MDYNRDHLTNLLARTGITNSDLARLIDVSRVTVYNWLKDGTPHRMIIGKYHRVIAAIEAAADAGDLPVVTRSRKLRHLELISAIKPHLRR